MINNNKLQCVLILSYFSFRSADDIMFIIEKESFCLNFHYKVGRICPIVLMKLYINLVNILQTNYNVVYTASGANQQQAVQIGKGNWNKSMLPPYYPGFELPKHYLTYTIIPSTRTRTDFTSVWMLSQVVLSHLQRGSILRFFASGPFILSWHENGKCQKNWKHKNFKKSGRDVFKGK